MQFPNESYFTPLQNAAYSYPFCVVSSILNAFSWCSRTAYFAQNFHTHSAVLVHDKNFCVSEGAAGVLGVHPRWPSSEILQRGSASVAVPWRDDDLLFFPRITIVLSDSFPLSCEKQHS